MDALREGGFGDLIYQCTCDIRHGYVYKSYDEKAKEEDYVFEFTENVTLKTESITRSTLGETIEHNVTVDTQLTIKTDGTVRLVRNATTSDGVSSFDVTGKWYNAAKSPLIVLDEEADYFRTFFGIQINSADTTLEHLKESSYSMLDHGELYYDIVWTDINN